METGGRQQPSWKLHIGGCATARDSTLAQTELRADVSCISIHENSMVHAILLQEDHILMMCVYWALT